MRAARAARRFRCARRSGPAGLAALVSDPRIRNLWVVMLVTPSKFRSLVCLSISSIAVSGSQGSSAPRPAVPPAAGAARGGNIRPPPRRVKGAGGSPRDAHILRRGPRGGRGHARKQRGARPGRCRDGPPLRENAPCWSAAPCSPTAFRRSTIGARGLNFRVRNGTGCASPAMAADQQGAFCCHGRAPVPSGPHSARTPNAPGSRARPRDPGVEEEELGLLVALG